MSLQLIGLDWLFGRLKLYLGGRMSNDNLILFPKKSNPVISMTQAEAKWMLSGSLLVVLVLAIGINSAVFSTSGQTQVSQQSIDSKNRAIASISPIFGISWEKRAFEILQNTESRELANVGKLPSAFDRFAFGTLQGVYSIRKIDGQIMEIRFAEEQAKKPKFLPKVDDFLNKHMKMFSAQANQIEKTHSHSNNEIRVERYEMHDKSGESLGTVQVLLDKDQRLLSMTVQ